MAKTKGLKALQEKAARLTTLDVIYDFPLAQLLPNSYNPNKQSDREFGLLLKSMTEDGFTQPIVVTRQPEGNVIVDGEHRWRAAHQLGFSTIPVVFVEMTAEQMRISTLRHNRARGSEDIQLSASVLRDLRELGALEHAMDSLGLDEALTQALLDDQGVAEAIGAAADAYNMGWAPGERAEALRELHSRTISQTPAAVAQTQQENDDIADASSRREQQELRRQQRVNVYRIVCVFGPAVAPLVKQVLGDDPAQALLNLCRKYAYLADAQGEAGNA